MHIRCPHCHYTIEVVEHDSLSDVTCPSCGSNFSLIGENATQTYDAKVKRVTHFDLLDQVGLGAFGAVWKARDTVLQRTVALKIPRRGQVTAEEAEYFFRDARAAAQLTHPNIVSVYEVGRDGDTIYIASKFIEGATLADWVEAHPLMPREAATLMVKVAEAIQHAHERGVIHRDLKPGNILVDSAGEPHVADFGLAKRDAGEITMTIDGQVLGTPAYMSPEQARGHGHQADARSDVYSLGVILFQLLTGELPFRGSKAMLVVQILNDEPPNPRKLNGRIPRDLETICLKAMAKEPGRRYATAADFAADLKRFTGGQPIQARPVGRVERAWRWCKRNPVVAGLAAAVMLSLAAGTIVSAIFAVRANEREEYALSEWTRAEANEAKALEMVAKESSLRRRVQFQSANLLFEQGLSKDSQGDSADAMLLMARSLVNFESLTRNNPDADNTEPAEARALSRYIRTQLPQIAIRPSTPRAFFGQAGEVVSNALSADGALPRYRPRAKRFAFGMSRHASGWETRSGIRLLTADEIRHKENALSKAGGVPASWMALADRRQQLHLASRTKSSQSAAVGGWRELSERGHKHARAERWKEAVDDMTAAVRARPEDHWLWVTTAELFLLKGDVEGYRQHCRDMLERFGQTTNPSVAERTAKACLLMPDSVADLAPVVRLADLALVGTEKHIHHHYFVMATGLARYRTGEFDLAIEQAKKCLSPDRAIISCDGPLIS